MQISSAKHCSFSHGFVMYLSLGVARKAETFPKTILKRIIPCSFNLVSPFLKMLSSSIALR